MRRLFAFFAMVTPLLGCSETTRPTPPASEDTELSAEADEEETPEQAPASTGIALPDPTRPGQSNPTVGRDPTLPDCYTPQNFEARFQFNAYIAGCKCEEQEAPEGLCLPGNVAMICHEGRWHAGLDGPCLPPNWGTPPECFSPTQAPSAGSFQGAENLPGCQCEDTMANRDGFCVESQAIVCDAGRWKRVTGGACSTPATFTWETCLSEGNNLYQETCPVGTTLLGAITRTTIEGVGPQVCCKRL